ncbi:four-carbon acid sugar kinase family protein [Microvirga sp. VF16]|uniref:four-carbon acid sugar kinase family protein n=1 Tax=Microvirga sp. VF16 TaxID=2807101 RepID=UPI00193D7E24|nr:four-carbon acid sugar kinase family protein [Microvirga sp. VF16]QRM31849.1 four-carbon acid sugar kinase family protein [Microvirga sp. VF16]
MPSYGWYGDDFTGATDTLATLARRGRRAFLFLRMPQAQQLAQVGDLDAVGIAGAARTMSPEEMRTELAPVGAFFRDLGIRILHYKCCSTFDSAPELGNIVVAAAILREYVTHETVAIVGGQPSLGRYCAFSNLFASFGAGGDVFRLDRHPTMSRHPATPMKEADLRHHLAALGMTDIGAIHWPLLIGDPEALVMEWQRLSQAAATVLLDALDGRHVDAIGRLLRTESQQQSLLVLGPSSVAQAFFEEREPVASPMPVSTDGPVLAFVGSLSPTTRAQMAAAQSYRRLAVDPASILSSADARERIVAKAVAMLARGEHVMLSTAPEIGDAPHVAAASLAEVSASLVDAILRRHPVRRLAVAGGDTSSRIVGRLGYWGLGYHSQISSGVAISLARSDDASRDGMLVMLKGGQMGHEQLFESFLENNAGR